MAQERIVADLPRDRFGKEVTTTAAAGAQPVAATQGKASG
jgi:hypothetical protein